MHSYNHHLGDYRKDTCELSMLEHGAYRLMLDHYYANEKPLPLDMGRVYRIALAHTALERRAVEVVLSGFFCKSEDGWHNKRADLEMQKRHAITEARRGAANARWSESDSNSDANAMQMQSKPDAPTRTDAHTDRIPDSGFRFPDSQSQDPPSNPPDPPVGGKRTRRAQRPAFVEPSLEEVEAEFDKQGFGGKRLGVKWLNKYRGNGWKLNDGNPIKDWKAVVGTWCERERDRQETPATPTDASERAIAQVFGSTQ